MQRRNSGLLKGSKQVNDAGGAGDVLCAWLLNDIDAGLEVFTCVVVKNQSALLTGLVLRREGVNEGTRQRDHSSLPGQAFVHAHLQRPSWPVLPGRVSGRQKALCACR